MAVANMGLVGGMSNFPGNSMLGDFNNQSGNQAAYTHGAATGQQTVYLSRNPSPNSNEHNFSFDVQEGFLDQHPQGPFDPASQQYPAHYGDGSLPHNQHGNMVTSHSPPAINSNGQLMSNFHLSQGMSKHNFGL